MVSIVEGVNCGEGVRCVSSDSERGLRRVTRVLVLGAAEPSLRVMCVIHVEVRRRRRRQPALHAVEPGRACVAANDVPDASVVAGQRAPAYLLGFPPAGLRAPAARGRVSGGETSVHGMPATQEDPPTHADFWCRAPRCRRRRPSGRGWPTCRRGAAPSAWRLYGMVERSQVGI